jgi:hypothetical protein
MSTREGLPAPQHISPRTIGVYSFQIFSLDRADIQAPAEIRKAAGGIASRGSIKLAPQKNTRNPALDWTVFSDLAECTRSAIVSDYPSIAERGLGSAKGSLFKAIICTWVPKIKGREHGRVPGRAKILHIVFPAERNQR